jgi:hypothetical protein
MQGELDMEGLAAKIAADGGTIMAQDDFVMSKIKKSKRSGDGDGKDAPAGQNPEDIKDSKKTEEDEITYDKDGRPIIKFRKVEAANPKKNPKKSEGSKDKKPGVKNQTLLSFGDDE